MDQAGTVEIYPSIHLKNYLLVPSLSHNLFYISQLTKELNCIVIISSTNCVVQDAQNGKIIRRCTKRGGFYYVDEATQKGHTLLAYGSPDHQLWMLHRRLGHPSLGYPKRLFPSLNNCNIPLNCEACVLAKSRKHNYFLSLTHGLSYFVLFVDDCT